MQQYNKTIQKMNNLKQKNTIQIGQKLVTIHIEY